MVTRETVHINCRTVVLHQNYTR